VRNDESSRQSVDSSEETNAHTGSHHIAPAVQHDLSLIAMHKTVENSPSRLRIAVCFFGLTRSLSRTRASIEQRLMYPLRLLGNVRVFVHTYNVTVINNKRSGEFGVRNNASEAAWLQPHAKLIDDQNAFLNSLPPSFCRKHGDAWAAEKDNFKSMTNFLCQLNSLRAVTRLMMTHGPFDRVVFARPDVLIYTPVDVQQLRSAPHDVVFVPPFDDYDGVNDRFAMGQYKPLVDIGLRGEAIAGYCEHALAHAERFLQWYVRERHIRVERTPMLFDRMRADGQLKRVADWELRRAN